MLILFLIAGLAIPTFAKGPAEKITKEPQPLGPPGKPDPRFMLEGDITALDAGSGTITVLVNSGNRPAHPFIGQEVLVSTTDDTLFYKKNGDLLDAISFDDLVVGENVRVNGLVLEGTFTAETVVAAGDGDDDDGDRPDGQRFTLKGTVTALDPISNTLTVLVEKGNRTVHPFEGLELELLTTDDTQFLRAIGDEEFETITFQDLQLDDAIQAWGTKDEDDVFTAFQIVVTVDNGNGDDKPMGKRFVLVGSVTALDPISSTVTIMVEKGNNLVRPFIGQELELWTTAETEFLRAIGDEEFEVITFDDLQVDDPIFAWGLKDGDDGPFVADKLVIRAGDNDGDDDGKPGVPFNLQGTITTTNSISGTVTVLVEKGNRVVLPYEGQELEILTTAETQFLLAIGDEECETITFDDLQPGDDVHILGGKDEEGVFIATQIIVKPPES